MIVSAGDLSLNTDLRVSVATATTIATIHTDSFTVAYTGTASFGFLASVTSGEDSDTLLNFQISISITNLANYLAGVLPCHCINLGGTSTNAENLMSAIQDLQY